jgi:DNA-binding MarR family transcriptional regulator
MISPSGDSAAQRDGPTRDERIIGGVDIRDVSVCACLQLRRTARMATQVFEAHLQPAGLTVGQFGVLAQLYGCSLWRGPVTIKELSALIGLDPTTLNRTLKPLEAQDLVSADPDERDRRARRLRLTPAGRERLIVAMPLWQAADREFRGVVGEETTVALNGLLDLAGRKLRDGD